MPEHAKKRLESLERLRAELDRVRAQADELHERIVTELHRVEADVGLRAGKAKRPPRVT